MTEFVICDQEVLEASIVPPALMAVPGACPPGIYETLRVDRGVIADWEAHWNRLNRSVMHYGLDLEWEGAADMISELCNIDSTGLKRLRLMKFMEPQTLKNGKQITKLAFTATASQATIGDFVCGVAETKRLAGDSSYNYKLLGRREADVELARSKATGCSDVIICNDRGEICEASYANIGVVMGDQIITPPPQSPCLPGITMAKVAEFAGRNGMTMNYKTLFLKDLNRVSEVFLASSVRGLQRVARVEGWFQEDLMSNNISVVNRMIQGLKRDLF